MQQEAEPAGARAAGDADAQQGSTQSFAAEMRAKAEAKRQAVAPQAASVRVGLSSNISLVHDSVAATAHDMSS